MQRVTNTESCDTLTPLGTDTAGHVGTVDLELALAGSPSAKIVIGNPVINPDTAATVGAGPAAFSFSC